MKRFMLFLLLSFITQMFAVTVDGFAFLEGETDHSGIQVFFQRVVPDTLFSNTVYTDSTGYYLSYIEEGYYDVKYSKTGFRTTILEDAVLYSDQTLAEQTLTAGSSILEGSIKGILQRGEYSVINTLSVLEGDSLIIEPGVVLNFSSSTNAKLRIYGYLKAEGTSEDSIIFKPTENYWGGIYVSNSIYTSMSYCSVITSENNGFTIEGSTCYFNNLSIGSFNDILRTGINILSSIVFISHSKIYAEHCLFMNPGYEGTELSITNSLLYSTSLTGDMLTDKVIFINCTMFTAGGMIGLETSELGPSSKIANCSVIAANPDDSVYGIYEGSMQVSCCNVYGFMNNFYNCGPYLGNNVTTNSNGDPCDAYGNISMDPRFVNTANGNFRLQSNSPCIDAGTNTITDYTFPVVDLAGNYRIWDGDGNGSEIVDMGVYEYGAPVGIEEQSVEVSDYKLLQNYPNPFNPVTTISYALPHSAHVELNVYNLNGQLVQSLVNGKMNKGVNKAEFNGADLTSGMYIYNLKVDGKVVENKKMMLLK